jgi:signal transduction histidine kinase
MSRKIKLEFVLIAAHQLKTPLSSLKWIFKMLLEGDLGRLTAEQKNLLAKGYEINEGMIILVNDLLNAARLEKGKNIYKFKRHNLSALIKSVVSSFSHAAEEKNITLKVDLPEDDLWMICDNSMVKMAVSNLIDNAIKYSFEGGKVAIGAAKKGKFIELFVSDSGVGIPSSQQRRVFKKFFRGGNITRFQVAGSGLGLHIAEKIMKAHGGRISFKSRENEGTVFLAIFPVKKLKR